MNIIPFGETIFVLPDKVVDKTDSGIILTDYSKKRPTSGTIIAIGEKIKKIKRWCPQWQMMCYANACSELSFYHPKEKCIKYNEEIEKEEDKFKIGQRVIYGEFSGHKQTITWNGKDEEIFIMTPSDILALLN